MLGRHARLRLRSSRRQRGYDEDGSSIVQLVLLMPLLALLLASLLHAGLFLMTRQAVVTATSEGLSAATLHGATPTVDGRRRASEVLDNHSPATDARIEVTANPTAGTVTMTVTANAPSVAPGLPRTITITQSGTVERFLP